MGVLGLWRLVDATGKPVPLETLEGKVLAIDISIWIHQVIQGYQDRRGNALPNAHLIGLFNRLCKLMYFKIKPIFVFDGGVPLLKKNTIAARRKLKSVAVSKAQKLKNDLINNLIKHAAVKGVLDKENHEGESSASQKDSAEIPGSSKEVDLFKLPKILSPRKLTNSEDYIDSDDEDFNETSPRKQTKWTGNIHSVDVNTPEFQSLPADVRYDILTDLKETRKQNSWGRLHELPTGSNNYAGFQIGRLLKRRYVQESLEKAEKEMGGRTLTLEELDRLLTDQGINTKTEDDAAFRIASDSTTRVLFASDKLSQNSVKSKEESEDGDNQNENKEKQVNDALSDSVSVHSENSLAIIDDLNAYDFEDWFSEGDFDENSLNESSLNDSHSLPASAIPKSDLNPALAYMLEHSGLTRDAVLKIVDTTRKNKQKSESNGSTSSKGAKKNSKRSSLMNKKKNLFRAFMASPKMKKKIPKSGLVTIVESNSETENGGMNSETIVVDVHKEESAGSNSESEDLEEVSKKSEVEAQKENDVESISDSDDFVEVSENTSIKNTVEKDVESQKESVMELSDSGSDDFVEVQDVPISKALPLKKDAGNGFQITIKADEELEDDIFADIFVDDNKGKKENTIVENKPVLDELVKKEITISPEKNNFSEAETKSPEKFLPELKSEPEPFTTPEKINLSPAKIEPISESKNLPEKMTPEEILKHIKSTLSLIKTTDDEKGIENIILNDKVIDLEDPAQLDQITNFIQENDSVAKNLFEEKDFLTQENKQSSEDIIEPDVIDELFKDKGLDKGFEEVTIIENNPPPLVLPQDEKELESMKQQLESEQKAISGTIGKLERQAVDITDQMRLEAQELLRLFGYPYIVAPMEAEAQCAYLEQIKLTNGTVTDDSDIWLFGGHCVYKNFFDNNKKVLQFLSDDIEHHFNLSRKEMIQLALLVGSDYTNGLCGVGPVTALEILASFPSDGEDILRGLRSFCAWYKAGRLSAPNKATLRNKLKHIAIERGFPSQAVVQAYLCPMVDESTEAFSWGKPNFTLLTDYVKQKFGWTKLKFDEIMNPILKKLSQTKTQRVMESYFKIQTIPKSIESAMSKRVHNAVQKLSGKIHDDEDTVNGKSKIEKIKKARKAAVGKRKKPTDDSEDVAASSDQNENTGEPQPKKPRKPRARKANKVVGDSEDTAVSGDPNENDGEPQPKKPRKPRARKAAGNSENAAENVGANEIDGEPQPKKPRKPRVKKAQKVENPIEEVNINKNEDNLETNEEASENLEKIPENQDFTTEFQNDDIKLKQRRICIGHETDEVIPQRERDKVNALNTKLKAIEIYRKSKMNQPATKKKRVVKKLKKDAELSEDSDSN